MSGRDPELQRLLDEQAIVAVALRYCRALDTNDWASLADVFLSDATAVLGGPPQLNGLDEITARCSSALASLDDSQHMVSNHEVVVDGDAATHRCYVQAQHIRNAAEGGPNFIIAGRYEDRLARTSVGWRITHRNLVVMWTAGNHRVVTGERDSS